MSAPVRGRVVPCAGCGLCARAIPIGDREHGCMACAARGGEQVTEWDGCTLGEPGEPRPAVVAVEAMTPGSPSGSGVW